MPFCKEWAGDHHWMVLAKLCSGSIEGIELVISWRGACEECVGDRNIAVL